MILVTTPTGHIGSKLVRNLLNAGESVRVIARDPAKLDGRIREQVEVVEGSHGGAATIDLALDGVEALFWCVPPTPHGTVEENYLGFSRPAADAVARRGTGHVVVVTALGRGTRWEGHAGLVTASLRMVDLFRATDAAVRGLAMPSFMENAIMQVDQIRSGQMFGPIDPDRALPHTATRDMAAAAARLLTDLSWSGHQDVPLLGPEDLSFDAIARIVSDVIGREVRYQQVPFDAFRTQLVGGGMPEDFADAYVAMMRAKNDGMDIVAESAVEERSATSFRAWAEDVLKPAVLG